MLRRDRVAHRVGEGGVIGALPPGDKRGRQPSKTVGYRPIWGRASKNCTGPRVSVRCDGLTAAQG